MAQAILFLGFGYVARALAPHAALEGLRLVATARTPESAGIVAAHGGRAFSWNEAGIDDAAFDDVSAIVISTPPGSDGCPAFAAASDAIAARARRLRWVGYLSSNGVYGDHGGAWVDEDTESRATSKRALLRLAAEKTWRRHAADFGYPLVIFRLPGIYGPGRSAIESVREGRAERIVKPGQVFNRMHVEDIAAALIASLRRPGAGDLFNLSDDLPAPPQDVVAFACDLLGVAPPPEIPFEDARLSDMAKSFYADNKRISNARARERLGLSLAYPTYKEGLRAVLAKGASKI
jgi:nucleoside-diphosphate-sugar epimerase